MDAAPPTGGKKCPGEKRYAPPGLRKAYYNHTAMLVAVVRKQMGPQFPVKPLVHDEGPFLFHTFLIQFNTFASFIAAVSTPAVHRFDRRDICSAWRPFPAICPENPAGRLAPSMRLRSACTKCG